jgi:hypothetical protein
MDREVIFFMDFLIIPKSQEQPFLRVEQIPEPSALILLTIGSLALLGHRSRGMEAFLS